ncbi:MAG: hypothetical protein JWO80_4746 [Bryobacterales bacterium]|nr:hypothetical protein [Bryobacterales bacterium]
MEAKKLTVEELGFKDVKLPYDRLPERAESTVPPAVWNLSRDSAGTLVRFTAATTEIICGFEAALISPPAVDLAILGVLKRELEPQLDHARRVAHGRDPSECPIR